MPTPRTCDATSFDNSIGQVGLKKAGQARLLVLPARRQRLETFETAPDDDGFRLFAYL